MKIDWPKFILTIVLTMTLVVVFLLFLMGCTTTGGVATSVNDEVSSLKCVGFCDLTITDRNAEIKGEVDLIKAEKKK